MSTGAGLSARRLHSVNDLLTRAGPGLTQLTARADRAKFWSAWLSEHLPAQLRARVSGVVEREKTLVIFAESAAWSARLRFAVEELEPQIHAAAAGLTAVQVRVLPRT